MKMQRKVPSATAPGASLLHRTVCPAPEAALQVVFTQCAFSSGHCHPLILTNMWSWRYSQGSESTSLYLTLRATFVTIHHCPWPCAQGEPGKAGRWQVPVISVQLGSQEDCTQTQQPLLSAPVPPAHLQLIGNAIQPHFMAYWDTVWSHILLVTWHSSTLVQGGQQWGK